MSDYHAQDFTTETGQQDLIKINRNNDITVAITGTAGSDDVDLEFTLDNPNKVSVERFTLIEDVLSAVSTYTKTFEGPVTSIGINIQANVSNDIKVRVLEAYRGG